MNARLARVLRLLPILLLSPLPGYAQDIPAILSDKVYQGQGVIDILKDVDPALLEQYFDQEGRLMLAVDVNEAASGNESNTSQGIAIDSVDLVIRTTAGDFTFSDFYTSTTALIKESGATASSDYYTVFGTGGSSSINGSTSTFDVSAFDDVIYLDNISFTGTILSASINVTFLATARTGTNETFFDFSGGFEDFAILGATEANTLEAANLGVADAPSTVSYASVPITAAPEPIRTPSSPGAPAPPLPVLIGLAVLALFRRKAS